MKGLSIRTSIPEDGELFKKILLQPEVLQYFPMYDLREIDDSVHIWGIFCKMGASLTSIVDEIPCGIAFLNIQGYKKFMHQCIITIVVDENFRNKGVGTKLLEALIELSREKFHLEMIHLEVYESNPAIRLYERMGFKKFGEHKNFIKEKSGYTNKILMQKEI